MTFKELVKKYDDITKTHNKELSAIKLLIYDHFNLDHTQLLLSYEEKVPKDKLCNFKERANRYLIDNIPIQYIIGYTYFYNLAISVTPDVLIPRFETEILVEKVIAYSNDLYPNQKINILDIGTGSGCIALALKANLPKANIYASDNSTAALNVAKKNAKNLSLDINFYNSNLFDDLPPTIKYDIIVSNPPYISRKETIDELVFLNEPHNALFAREEGLYYYRKIIQEAPQFINDNGLICFEIGHTQSKQIIAFVNKYLQDSQYKIYSDFNNHERIIIIKNS